MVALNDYIFDQNYEMVIERVRMKPEEARNSDVNGVTPLHWLAFFRAPLYVIEAVCESYPDALYALNSNGNTPLDVAIHRSTADVVEFLRRSCLCLHRLHVRRTPNEEFTQMRGLSTAELSREIKQLHAENYQLFHMKKAVSQKVSELEYSCSEQQEKVLKIQRMLQTKDFKNDDFRLIDLQRGQPTEMVLFKGINAGY